MIKKKHQKTKNLISVYATIRKLLKIQLLEWYNHAKPPEQINCQKKKSLIKTQVAE